MCQILEILLACVGYSREQGRIIIGLFLKHVLFKDGMHTWTQCREKPVSFVEISIRYIGLAHTPCWFYVLVFDLAGPERQYGFRYVCAQAGSVRNAKKSCIERWTLNIRAV